MWPKKSIIPKTPAPDTDGVLAAADAAAVKAPAGTQKEKKPVSYQRGKYAKSGKVAARKNFAKVMAASKEPKLK